MDSKQSPNGKYEVAIFVRKLGLDSKLSVVLISGESTTRIFRDPADRKPLTTHITWSNDSRFVGVYEVDGFAAPLLYAYDVAERQAVDPSIILPEIRRSLIAKYALQRDVDADPSFDVLKWVRNQEIKNAQK
jgi:hypothetical protein